MPNLSFRAVEAAPLKFAVAPTLALRVELDAGNAAVHSVLLQTQVRVEAPARSYSGAEAAGLHEIFGPRAEWNRSVKSFLWCNATTTLRAFTGRTIAELLLPCTFDFAAMAAKYFHALESGEVPLSLLFSGTVFYQGEAAMSVTQLPWSAEAKFSLPLPVWQATLDHYYPNGAPLTVRRDLFDRLYRYQVAEGLTSFDQALERLLAGKS